MSGSSRPLSKAQVEQLMESVDTDRFLCALRSCLVLILGAPNRPADSWEQLIERSATLGGWSEERAQRVRNLDLDALYDLATELNERRTLRP